MDDGFGKCELQRLFAFGVTYVTVFTENFHADNSFFVLPDFFQKFFYRVGSSVHVALKQIDARHDDIHPRVITALTMAFQLWQEVSTALMIPSCLVFDNPSI